MSDAPDSGELMEMLGHPRGWRVRGNAIEGLVEVHTPNAIGALLSAVYDESPHVASTADHTLHTFGAEVALLCWHDGSY